VLSQRDLVWQTGKALQRMARPVTQRLQQHVVLFDVAYWQRLSSSRVHRVRPGEARSPSAACNGDAVMMNNNMSSTRLMHL
jgi:hypothetical protein